MPTTIITRNSVVPGVAPSAGQLVLGELAVNVTDRKLYTLDGTNSVVLLSAGGLDPTDPFTITVNSSTTALTVTQSGSGGGVRITNTGAGNSLVVEDSANPDSTPFVIDTNGRIIAGYTSAVTTAPGISPLIQTNGVGAGILGSIGMARWDANANTQYLQFTKSRSGTVGTFGGVVSSDDLVGTIQWSADDGTGPINLAQITATVDGTPGTNDMPGRLTFSTTADGSSTPTERLRITSAGGISFGNTGTAYGLSGQILSSAGNAPPTWVDQFTNASFVFSGAGSPILPGYAGDLQIPFNCVILEASLIANQSGSIVIAISKSSYAGFPGSLASIVGSSPPTLSSAQKSTDSTLTGWTTSISANDILRFSVTSASSVTSVTLNLKIRRT
jgi:hypothetical protein